MPEEYSNHLQAHVPEDKYDEPHHWIAAIKKEIDAVLLPKVRERRPDPDGYLAAAADLLAPEKMLEDVGVEERLDAQIDRALRQLFWLKTQKKLDREAKQKIVDAIIFNVGTFQRRHSVESTFYGHKKYSPARAPEEHRPVRGLAQNQADRGRKAIFGKAAF